MYDQRLFNQEQGMGSGLASDDTYNLYDKALFADRGTGLFRPTAAAADEDAPPGAGAVTLKLTLYTIASPGARALLHSLEH